MRHEHLATQSAGFFFSSRKSEHGNSFYLKPQKLFLSLSFNDLLRPRGVQGRGEKTKTKVISLPHCGERWSGSCWDGREVSKQPGEPVSNPSDQVFPSTKLLGPKLGYIAAMAWCNKQKINITWPLASHEEIDLVIFNRCASALIPSPPMAWDMFLCTTRVHVSGVRSSTWNTHVTSRNERCLANGCFDTSGRFCSKSIAVLIHNTQKIKVGKGKKNLHHGINVKRGGEKKIGEPKSNTVDASDRQ